MINKVQKIINNKFSRVFKFVFFLRYLFAIFFVAIVLFLFIPQFFDYTKKEKIIKNFLSQNYGLQINKLENIKFNTLPVPHLQIDNLISEFYSESQSMTIQKLIIYPELYSIYNYENFQVKKIKIINSNFQVNLKNSKFLLENILNLKKKIHFMNLNLKIQDGSKFILDLKEINFLNYGYKKNIIKGKFFNKEFKINFVEDLSKIDFKLLDTGISLNLNISETNKSSPLIGSLKGKILKSNFKLDFSYDDKSIIIKKLLFRDKNLSFDSNGEIELQPYSKFVLNTEIKNFESLIFKNFEISKLLRFNKFIKKINSQNNIFFKSRKFSNNLIDDLDIKSNLSYGRLTFLKKILISNTEIICRNNINLLSQFPILYFDCSISSLNKKKFLKKFNINYKSKNKILNLVSTGNLNILNNKVNFDKIQFNNNYNATDEDLKYFKNTFEIIMLDKDFINMFSFSKIKKFISEIL